MTTFLFGSQDRFGCFFHFENKEWEQTITLEDSEEWHGTSRDILALVMKRTHSLRNEKPQCVRLLF